MEIQDKFTRDVQSDRTAKVFFDQRERKIQRCHSACAGIKGAIVYEQRVRINVERRKSQSYILG